MTAVARDLEDIVEECPADSREAGRAGVCQECPGKELCLSQGSQADPEQHVINTRLGAIRHKVLVLSGKGGVGKSTMAVLLAQMLAAEGQRVGLLDVDVCGPSIPHLLGVEDQPVLDSQWGWQPAVSPLGKIKTLSVGSLLSSQSQAVVWKGPRKTALIRRMIKDTMWGRLDTLVVDTPPGTSDEHLTIVRLLATTRPSGAVVLTSPQRLAAGVVSREIRFCQKMNIPVLGIIENMSGFCCPCCSEVSEVFPGGAGAHLAEKYQVPLLGTLPLHLGLAEAGVSSAWRDSPVAEAVMDVVAKIKEKL
ncbi:Cytosolic Fe-S cluster assembly factor nubp1 [Chionoecetes opilio]|uniref:Cytosolic Fe-S cluster assembly factor nubp1 n=1 Tax=Chionoecetes opilio TaxID=41210 RepID=A0A8J4XZ56_CHIOP|nr:Cytosolic Fe-S cluster assembly factor nubp1 [Chionoecetes opilio]